jgi:histone demethylase JARID1
MKFRLEPNLKQMIDRELEGRRLARDKILHLEEFNDPEDRAEEQYQCAVCKTLSYLSQITCACTENVACLEHHDSFCICVDEASRKLTLRTRYTDEEIRMIYQTVLDRTTLPQTWSNRLRDLLASSPTPPIKSLKAILADAESSGAPEQEAVDLANFVTRAEAWTSLAVTILTRKAQPRKRSRKSKGGSEDASNDPEYTLEDAEALLDELEMLGFQSPEVVQLSDAYRETRLLRTRVIAFLDLPLQNRDIDKAEVLLSDCKDKILAFPEVPSLEQSVEFLRLLQELDQVDDTTLTLDYVDELLQRAQANKMDPEHEYYRELVAKQELGQIWKQKAADILRSKSATIEELYEIANPLAGTPTVEKMRNTLQAMWSKAKDLEKTSRSILSGNRERKPTPEEVIAMINRSSDISIPVVDELKVLAKRGGRISSISKAIIKGTFQGEFDFPLDQLFATLCVWREETKRDLMMFNIPNFIDVDAQLTKHEAWLKTHPWSKRVSSRLAPANPFTEAFAVLQDVIIQTSTFDSDVPGFDCTCICKFPVVIESGGPNAVKCDSCDAKVMTTLVDVCHTVLNDLLVPWTLHFKLLSILRPFTLEWGVYQIPELFPK